MTAARPPRLAPGVAGTVEAVTAWARQHPDIRALALVGSQAHGAARPDSDVDFVVLTDSPHRYLDEDERLRELAAIETTPPRPRGAVTERRLTLASGIELDLGFGTPRWAATEPVDPGTRRVVSDGIRVLHDPHRLLADLAVACGVGG